VKTRKRKEVINSLGPYDEENVMSCRNRSAGRVDQSGNETEVSKTENGSI